MKLERLANGGLIARFQAMASPCEVQVEGASAAELTAVGEIVEAECLRIQDKWSRYRSDNIIHAINSAKGARVEVDEETAKLIDFGELLHGESEGRFDLTSGVLRRAWQFAAEARLPEPAHVAALLERVGWHRVVWQRPLLTLRPGMELDLGGVGKKYAVDRAIALASTRTTRAVLVNLGGDLAVSKAREDGGHWRIGIDSGTADTATPLVRLQQGAVATSGDQHRHLLVNGVRYGHILDARTGWPPADGPRSVTVAAANCMVAGALSTIAVLHGRDAEAWLAGQGVDFHVTRAGTDAAAQSDNF